MLFSLKEVAERLRISRTSVWRLVRRRDLPIVRIGSRRLVRSEDLEAFIASRTAP